MDILRRKVIGFTLLEVMASIAIASFGLIALATMQMSLVRASAESRTQSVAVALAKEKLEQLRSFETSVDYLAIDSEAAVTINREGVDYFRSTSITRYVYDTATAVFATKTNTAGGMGAKDFKQARVTVTWTDAAGATQSLSLEDVIDGLSPSDSAKLLAAAADSSARKVQVRINDPAADDMVIPMALSSDVESAATNPKPNVVRGTNTVETSFDVITYSGLNDGATRTAQAKVETLMVGCTCDYGNGSATAKAKRPTYWNGTRYTVPVDTSYTAPAGPATSFASQQSEHCDICCRDHHDPVGAEGATFSPLKVTKAGDKVTAAHPHYLDKSTVVPVTAGYYKEACRLIRVDGVWSVAADLSNDYFALLATGDGTNAGTPIPDSTSVAGSPPITGAVARYQKFVLDYMGQRFVTPTPSSGSEQSTYNAIGDPDTLAASPAYVLDNPLSIPIVRVDSVGKWLHSRGLYVDYLEKETVDAITDAKASAPCQASASAMDTCILRLLPFTTINLTEIADWAPLSGPLTVTNNDYSKSLASGDPVRGKVTTNGLVSDDGVKNVTVSARKSNSGLLDLSFDAISADDAITLSDIQKFSIGNGTPADVGSKPFQVGLTMPTGFSGTPNVSYLTDGTVASLPCGNLDPVTTLICNVANGTVGPPPAGLGVDGTMSIVVGGFNSGWTVNDTSHPISCTYGGGDTSGGWLNISSGTTGYAVNMCPNYSVNSVRNVTQNEDVTANISVTADGLSAETATVKFNKLYEDDNVVVVFNASSTTPIPEKRPTTCTYTCSMGDKADSCQAGKVTFHFPEPEACN